MKIKRFLAAAAASVVAVSAMAVVASAEAIYTQTASKGGVSENFVFDFTGFTEDQIKTVTKVEAKVSADCNYFKGVIGYNNASTAKWTATKEIEVGNASGSDPASGSFVCELTAGDLAAKDKDGNYGPYMEVQFWWVNGLEYEGTTITKDGTVSIESVKLYDAAGNEVVAGGNTTKPDDTSKPSESDNSGSGDNSGSSGDNVNTGVEGVAAVVGVAALAGAALVVARKRK